MNVKYSLTLLTTVCLSLGISAQESYAQQGRIVINPTPLESGEILESDESGESDEIQEPSQSTLMEPIDIEDQKLRRERALLDSIVVPEPGSSYFSDQVTEEAAPAPTPMAEDEMVDMPADEGLTPLSDTDEVDEYERWAAEQKAKYKNTRKTQPMTPVEVDAEPPPMPIEADASMTEKPKVYSREERLSTSSGMIKQVEEMGVEAAPAQSLPLQTDWNALEGSSVHEILQGWCSQADVRLIWQGQSDFAVANPFIMRSTFERAVQKLLDQYQGQVVRPVATLHIDPETNVKTLVVRVVEGQ